MLTNNYVFVLTLNILPNNIDDPFTTYKEFTDTQRNEMWYNNKVFLGNIRELSK